MQEEVTRGVVSVLQWIVMVLVWQILLYGLGYAALYACSAGRWPRAEWEDRLDDRISFAGLGVLALAWTLVTLYNNGVLG